MKLSKFKFKLPEELIAQYPTEHRDEARMLVLHRKTGEIEHLVFKDIIKFFDEGDLFVFNDTQVFPARLYGNKEKTGAQIEVFLLRELTDMSHANVGKVFNRDHATVVASVNKIKERMKQDPVFEAQIDDMMADLKASAGY